MSRTENKVPHYRVERTDGLRILAYGNVFRFDPKAPHTRTRFQTLRTLADDIGYQDFHWVRVGNKFSPDLVKKVMHLTLTKRAGRDRVRFHTTCADGVLIHDTRVVVAIASRDCPILVLFSVKRKMIMVLHCSREALHGMGTENPHDSVILRALTEYVKSGGDPEHDVLEGYIFNGISAEHFHNERYPDVVNGLIKLWGPSVVPDRKRMTIDLKELIYRQLEEGGVPNARLNVVGDRRDTFSDPGLASLRGNKSGYNVVLVGRDQKHDSVAYADSHR